ncbi:MAG: 4Fe-4S dicluster domain-containing protein [Coriobacteriia bacterium]|nr:4Fe-4S dicluster domain-containing protein [Coriobacteriia bacterium]
MAKLGFYYNEAYCVGCRTCQIACKEKNGLSIGVLYRRVRSYETGAFPTPGYYHFASTCNHCLNPICVRVCPSGSMHIAEDESIQHDDEICIGCKSCVNSCPYGVPQYLEDKEIAGKCDLCIDLRAKGENPVCVDACPQFAFILDDIEKLRAQYPDAVTDLPILPDSTQTNPSTIIAPRACALKEDFREKPI